MGANAQTTVPTFTAGDVLTADQMNQSARTGVPVFAGTAERDAAFGGTGEKTLAEGQLCYLESTNVVQYYDGSNWATVGPQTVTTPGMVRITGASFSAAASVEFANDVFTSTYKIYCVVFNCTSSSTGQNLSLRMRNNSGPVTGSNYTGQAYYVRGSNSTLNSNATSAQTSHLIGGVTTVAAPLQLWIANPVDAAIRTSWWGLGTRDTAFEIAAGFIGGQYTVAETHTGLNFFVSGTMTGEYDVYGLADS